MAIGDVYPVDTATDVHYTDTGMYDVEEYGSVYILDTERPAIVDTGIGTNYERILEGLETVGIEPEALEAILVTHVHLDHAGGAGFLAAETDADVYVHESGSQFLVDPTAIWAGTEAAVGEQIQFYTEPEPIAESRIVELEDGDTVDLGSKTLDVHRATGHAFHQVIFHDADDGITFTGDAAGIYVPSRDRVTVTSPPPGFDLETVVEDARMIERLSPETICYAHYGPAPVDDRLSTYVDAITDWVRSIEAKRAELDDDEAVVDYFAERTDLDEVWGVKKAIPETKMNVRGVLTYLDDRDD